MIELRNLTKIYNENAENQVIALDHVSFTLPENGMVFLLGKSGSGKTTMLNLLGGLDAPSEGELCIDGASSAGFRQKDWDAYRNNYVGFVFQEYNLLDDLTIGANIALALNLQGKISKTDAEQKISAVLEQVGLSGYGNRKPAELSGGQKQRIAIARALVKNPQMILADEPTGALDSENRQQIFDLLKVISAEKLVVIVSHDEEFARRYADRIIRLSDGKVIADSARPNMNRVTYHPNMVRVPANYVFTDEEWATVQAYMQACLLGENPEPPARETLEETLALEENTFHTQESFTAKTVSVPWKNAIVMALQSMKKRKVRLTIVAVLCTLAFLLVGASDLIASYDQRNVLIKSLCNSDFNQIAITKEQYLDYDMTKISPLLPTYEAVDQFLSSKLAYFPGMPGWYDGYMLGDADLQDLSNRTGMTFKGVYVPPSNILSLEPNYSIYSEEVDRAETPALTGFMDFTQEDLELFGFNMVAGRLPDGKKDELAISKLVYEAFVKCGYLGFDYEIQVCYTSKKDLYHADRSRSFSWTEYFANDFQAVKDLIKEIEGDISEYQTRVYRVSSQVQEITCPEDLIGQTLFLENRFYTITGIIDTGFDPAAEAERSSGRSMKRQEQELGISYMAFVGEGRTAEIAARYPSIFALRDSAIDLSFDYSLHPGAYEESLGYYTISNNVLGRLSSIDSRLINMPKQYTVTQMWHTELLEENPAFLPAGRPYANVFQGVKNFEMEYASTASGAWLTTEQWRNTSLWGWSNRNIWTVCCMYMDYHSPSFLTNNIEILSYWDVYFVDDFMFDLLTEGRANTYSYAIGVLPHNEDAVANLINGAWEEKDNTKYKLENLIVYELDSLNSTLLSLSKIFRYVGLGMALFAAAIFWNFTSTGINQRKREIGILRALGANGNTIFRIFFTESFALAGINAVLATLLTFLTSVIGNLLMRTVMDSRLTVFSLSLRQVGIIFILSFGIAFIASIIPILRIARQKPVDAIRE